MSDLPFGFLLVDAVRLYRARVERAFEQAGLGLTSGEARTLFHVSLHPGLRQGVLAELMSVEPMTMVGFLDRLETRGLIARASDPQDRRAKIVNLTPAAAPLLTRVRAVADATRAEIFSGIDEKERDLFRSVLMRLRSNLDACARKGES